MCGMANWFVGARGVELAREQRGYGEIRDWEHVRRLDWGPPPGPLIAGFIPRHRNISWPVWPRSRNLHAIGWRNAHGSRGTCEDTGELEGTYSFGNCHPK